MITKAIIEEKVSEYKYRVRIPLFDRSKDASLHTATKDLCIATVITSKGVYNNFTQGDVVFVSFENNEMGKPVIIGHLYRQALTQDILNAPIVDVRSLNVTQQVNLPKNINIGGQLNYEDLFSLANIDGNIQEQINSLKLNIDKDVQEQLDSLEANLRDNQEQLDSLESPTQKSGTISYFDRDTINYCRGNRFECLPKENITNVHLYKRLEGATSWDDEVSFSLNNNVFNTSNFSGFSIGDNSDNIKDSKNGILYSEDEYQKKEYRLEFELKMDGIYSQLQKLVFWVSTSGSSIKFYLYGKRGQDTNFNPLGEMSLQGWSGSNLLPIDITVNGASTETFNSSQYNTLKFVFESGVRDTYYVGESYKYRNYPDVMKIAAYGINAWTYLNNMANFDHIYTWDNDCNVVFPKYVKTNANTIDESDDKSFVTIGYLKSKGLI